MLTEPIYTDPFHPHLIMHRVEGGSFMMGSEAYKDERPVHAVTVPTFYMGKFPVTQSLWEAVMGNNPSAFKGEIRPVENVSWLDIVNDFLPKLHQITRKRFRLPSEAEWEFAGRGGKKSAGFLYCGSDRLKQVGWFEDNSDSQTHPVGLKKGNELGLYDMSGNVYEWCMDNYNPNYFDLPNDGSAWLNGDQADFRVLRGGGYFDRMKNCRASYRENDGPDFCFDYAGFRLALTP